jgi:uncharacterized protein YbgA (DUF1722 family)/uncharacterized protein YbbK (DUF523 family)
MQKAVTSGNSPLRMAISSCLLGHTVRYDGGHKHNAYATQTLGRFFELIPYCPEVAIGLGVPRPPLQLVRVHDEVRVRGVNDPTQDVTEALITYGHEVATQLQGVSGYLFKKASPSCGTAQVNIHDAAGRIVDTGPGLYAATLMACLPELPVVDEERLLELPLRDNFLERVFVYHRWQQLCRRGITRNSLLEFHARHKFIVLAHDEPAYRELGRLVADLGGENFDDLARHYLSLLMQALRKIATPKQHANVLLHIMGFFKAHLSTEDKRELLELIEQYTLEQVPLLVPVSLLKHHLRRYPDEYLQAQYYLNPHPAELMLRYGP